MLQKIVRARLCFLCGEKVIDAVLPCRPLIGQHSERWIDILINAMLLACNRKNDYLIFLVFLRFGFEKKR